MMCFKKKCVKWCDKPCVDSLETILEVKDKINDTKEELEDCTQKKGANSTSKDRVEIAKQLSQMFKTRKIQ